MKTMLTKLLVLLCLLTVSYAGIVALYKPWPGISEWRPKCTTSMVYSYFYKRCITKELNFLETYFDYNYY